MLEAHRIVQREVVAAAVLFNPAIRPVVRPSVLNLLPLPLQVRGRSSRIETLVEVSGSLAMRSRFGRWTKRLPLRFGYFTRQLRKWFSTRSNWMNRDSAVNLLKYVGVHA
jgi:hypothetical protein